LCLEIEFANISKSHFYLNEFAASTDFFLKGYISYKITWTFIHKPLSYYFKK